MHLVKVCVRTAPEFINAYPGLLCSALPDGRLASAVSRAFTCIYVVPDCAHASFFNLIQVFVYDVAAYPPLHTLAKGVTFCKDNQSAGFAE